MRERTTWNRDQIAKYAAHAKKADPATLNNPDHMKAQPSADAYNIGTPSDFAEDVHPSSGTWEAEYSNGQVKRNEIGMPEMRGDTFNHPEKTASEEVLTKKAALCIVIARSMLPKNASFEDVEMQSFSLMHMPDSEVMATYNRLAQQQEQGQQAQDKQAQQEQNQGQQQAQDKQAQQGQQQQEEGQKQAQQEQAQQDQGQKQAQQSQAQEEQAQKEAGQMPPQFRENAEKKKEEAEAKKDEGQSKEANQQMMALQDQIAQMQQQLAQMMQQGGQQAPMQQQSCGPQMMAPASDDQLIDQMLADGGGIAPSPSEMDIELEASSMDIADVRLEPQDEVLKSLFANDEESQAQQAQQAQQKQAHSTRTASTRTVGTRPTQGVSQIGGSPSSAGGNDVSKLSSLWGAAPDVSEAFGITKR